MKQEEEKHARHGNKKEGKGRKDRTRKRATKGNQKERRDARKKG